MPTIPMDMLASLGAEGAARPAARVATWCRPYSAKDLAALFDISPKTAAQYRVGAAFPNERIFSAMVARWGRGFLLDVFAEDLALTDQEIADEWARTFAALAMLRRAHLRGRDDDQTETAQDPGECVPPSGDGGGPAGALARAARKTALILMLGLAVSVPLADLLHLLDNPVRVARTTRNPVPRSLRLRQGVKVTRVRREGVAI